MDQEQKNYDDSYNLRKIFEEIELDLVKNLVRNMKRHEIEEQKEGFRWEMWQAAKLRNLRQYKKQNQEILGKRQEDIRVLIEQAIKGGYAKGKDIFDKIAARMFRKKRVKFPKGIKEKKLDKPAKPELDFFGMNDKKITALHNSASHDIKKAQSAVLRRMDDIYRKTVYKATMYMTAGTKSLEQAIDLATKDFLEKGIDCIEYKNGNRVNIASYAEMAIRTASHRAVLLGEGKERDKWGIHTVIVSAHANTCPLCAPWQGKILIDDVFSSGTKEEALKLGYPLLSDAIRARFLHPNCRHTVTTYFGGITQIPEIPDSDKAIETYRYEQQQRAIERQIRKWKRIAEGSIDPQNINYANEKVKQYQNELRKHLKIHKELRRNYSREKTRGVLTKNSPASSYGYENFDREHLAKEISELLPNFKQAVIPESKVSGYALNFEHESGKNKAIAFEKALGYTINNKDALLEEVRLGLRKYKASARAKTKYGQPYEVAMIIKGANGRYAKVKTGWIIDNGTVFPRLTTIYVDN